MDAPALIVVSEGREYASQVDSFLVEALSNPRHRLTVLRMELDIQAFLRNADKQQFEFQNFPTSYLRCAAHRVAQHYGLQTMALDTNLDGSGKILAWKTPESRFPYVCLSDIPAKQAAENDNSGQKKIVICARPDRGFRGDADQLGVKHNSVRSVEERKEEYDRARARIFNGSNKSEEVPPLQVVAEGRSFINRDAAECLKNTFGDSDKVTPKDGSSRVAAIFRDREKDRTDPDYDRSYDRYSRSTLPNQSLCLDHYNVLQPPFMQYDSGFPQLGQVPRVQTTPLTYRIPNPIMNGYPPSRPEQTSGDVVYMQWPSPAMMYAHSYGHFRHASFQVPFYQQPLSFENSQKL